MRFASFAIDTAHPSDQTTSSLNQTVYAWLPILPGPASDPMVTTDGGELMFTEAGLYVITANLTCNVTLPTDDEEQYAVVTGALAFGTGGVVG